MADMRPPFAYVRKITWLHRTFKGMTLTMDFGWGNGYVSLPPGHPWYAVPYEDIPVLVHGGLTYGEMQNGRWVIGFDTAHYMDTLIGWSRLRVDREAKVLLKAANVAKFRKQPLRRPMNR